MTPDSSFASFLIGLRQGDSEAARQLFARYANRLIGLARQHLDARLRGKVDPEDIQQSVFKSFFRCHHKNAFVLNDWDDLWSLLSVIAVRKCGHCLAYYRAGCRDFGLERAVSANEDDSNFDGKVVSREPAPLESAMLSETVEELLQSFDQRDRVMVLLALQGYTRQEIAEQVCCAERTVYRVLRRLRRQMERFTEGVN